MLEHARFLEASSSRRERVGVRGQTEAEVEFGDRDVDAEPGEPFAGTHGSRRRLSSGDRLLSASVFVSPGGPLFPAASVVADTEKTRQRADLRATSRSRGHR